MNPADFVKFKNLIDSLTCCASYKDLNSVFTLANTKYAEVVELKHSEDVVGRTAFEMPARSSDCAALSHAQDQKVIKTNKPLTLLGIHPDARGTFKAYKYTKAPVANNGKVAGIFVTGEDITSPEIFELSIFLQKYPIVTNGKLLLDGGSYIIGREHGDVALTPREHEVLFYFLRRTRAKVISDIFNISQRTIYKTLYSLREKFNAHTSAELKDKAIEMDFLNLLPLSVFQPRITRTLSTD